MTIRRFKNKMTIEGDHLVEHPNGDWVDYADHEKIVQQDSRLLAQATKHVETANDALLQATARILELEERVAELERYDTDADYIRQSTEFERGR